MKDFFIMPYNKDVDVKLRGNIAGMSLDDIGRRIIENMRIMDVLGALSNGYHDQFGYAEKAPEGFQRSWNAIDDLMAHFEDDVFSLGAEPIETNQLALIRQLLLLNLIDSKESAALRDKFNDRVKEAAGVELDEQALQGLFDLFSQFDIGKELADIRGVAKKDLRPFER